MIVMAVKKEVKKPAAKKQEKKPVKRAAEKKVPAAKKIVQKEDIWAEEKVEKKSAEKIVEKEAAKQSHVASAREIEKAGIDSSIIFYPLVTEKAVNMIESQNKLCFVVAGSATKPAVKKTIEAMYGAKVDSVNIVRDMKGRKKAIVKINKKFKADEIAMKLGVI